MYKLDNIQQVGWIQISGGIATMLAGIVAQIITGLAPDQVAINNVLYFGLFAFGWFMFNQLVMATLYNKIVDDAKRAKLTRLTSPMDDLPPGRWGQSFRRVEIGLMVIWVLSIVILQFALGANLTLALGGLAGGWLAGGGIGRLRFVKKLRQEETDQESRFYFSDATLGPRTEIAYYTTRPVEDVPVEAVAPTSQTSLPPGVKRRAVASSSTTPKTSPANPKTKSTRSGPDRPA